MLDQDAIQDQRLDQLEEKVTDLTIEVRSLVQVLKGLPNLVKGLAAAIVAAIGGTTLI